MRKMAKLLMASCLAASFNTFATTVPYLDFNALVDSSEHVVGGVVKSIKLKKEKDGQFYTVLHINDAYTVTENGEIPQNRPMKIRMLGGEEMIYDDKGQAIGARGLSMHGTPEFKEGQEVILFVSHNGDADMPIVGWQQGRFNISDADTIQNGHGESIVGLQNADLITMVDGEPTVKGKSVLRGKERAAISGKKPEIVGSDGGQDHGRVIGASKASENALSNSAAFMELGEYEFKSMIQERKSIKSQSAHVSRKPDIEKLFTLPEVAVEKAAAKSARINDDGTFNSAPVDVLSETGPSKDLKLPAAAKIPSNHAHQH